MDEHESHLKRLISEAPASQGDSIDRMMDDPSTTFFQGVVTLDIDAIRNALIANGWTITLMGGVELTQQDRWNIIEGEHPKPPTLRVLPYLGDDGMIMARYQLYDPVFFCRHKQGVTVTGFKQELRPIVDILKSLEQKKLE